MPGAADTAGRRDYPESSQPSDQPRPPGQPADHALARLQQRLDHLPDGHPSSPRDDDGSQRAPAVRLKDLELPINDDTPTEAWRESLPALQAAWENHRERWPETSRPPVDRSTDEPGSWRGDGGQYLNTEENIVTEHALDRVYKTEDSVNVSIKAIEAAVPGALLVGLEHCRKGEDRFKEKVSYEVRAKPEQSIDQIANDLPDAIRYTYQFDTDSYAEGYRNTYEKLQENGYVMEFCRNSWEDPQYRGINTRWREPTGQLFEVQFHTPESFSAKQLTHYAYERIRNPNTLDLERDELHEFQERASNMIPLPAGALSIPNYRKREINDS